MTPGERETCRLYARLPVFRRRVERAKAVVRRALEDHPGRWGVSCSGGKDSTATLGVALNAGWRGPVFFFYCAETPTENARLVEQLARDHGLELIAFEVPGAWDVFHQHGRFFLEPETDGEVQAVRSMLRGYKEVATSTARDAGLAGLFWGMRRAESKARAVTLSKHGPVYRADGRNEMTACPLFDWDARDVWAFLLAEGLPWLERYDDAVVGRDIERSEETWLACGAPWTRSHVGQELRRRDPARYRELAERWPDLTRYT